MIKDYWANLIQTAWIAVEKPMAEEKKQINWNNVCMSNTGKAVAAKRALLNTTSLIVFKQKEKKPISNLLPLRSENLKNVFKFW